MSDYIKEQDPNIGCLLKLNLNIKTHTDLKVKGQRKIHHANTNQKKAAVAILISDRADFTARALQTDKGINSLRRHNPYCVCA